MYRWKRLPVRSADSAAPSNAGLEFLLHQSPGEARWRLSVLKITRDYATKSTQTSGDTPEFDYSSLPPTVERFLRGQASRIRQYGTKSIIQIGKDLVGAKHYLSHGAFLRWVEDEVGIPARTAQSYMRVASWTSSKSAIVALLPPSVLYVLSSPGVPTEFVRDVLRRVEAGERIRTPSLRAEIRTFRETATQRNNSSLGKESDGQPDDVRDVHRAVTTTAMISDVVQILARALTASDFAQVRNIVTSKAVLDDPNLPRLLERAFESHKPAPFDSREPRHTSRIGIVFSRPGVVTG